MVEEKEVKKAKELSPTQRKLLAPFFRLLTLDSEIYLAVRDGKVEAVRKMLKNGIDTNYVGMVVVPYLYTSIMKRNDGVTLLLLENGANADASYTFFGTACTEKILHTLMALKRVSDAKLLIWYGAKIGEVSDLKLSISNSKLSVDPILNSISQDFIRKSQLEIQFKEASATKLHQICEELSQLWRKQAENELNATYRGHYVSKASYYLEKAKEAMGRLNFYLF